MKLAATHWRLLVKASVALAVLGLLFHRVDWVLLSESTAELKLGPLALACIFFGAIAALEVARLRSVLISYGLSWVELLRLHLVGLFFGSFLPGQVGADLFRVLALRSSGGSLTRPLTLILSLRLLGLAVLACAAVTGFALHDRPLLDSIRWHWGPFLIAAGVAALLISALMSHPRLRIQALGFARAQSARCRKALALLGPAQLAAVVLLSCLILVARALVLFFLVRAVGHSLAPMETLLIVALAALATTLPISFAGLGVREGVVAFLLVEASLSYERALLVALLGRVLILLVSAVGGVWLVGSRRDRERAPPRPGDAFKEPPA